MPRCFLWIIFMCVWISQSVVLQAQARRILVFTRTLGYRHASIPDGVHAIAQLCRSLRMDMDTTSDATRFTPAALQQYAAVVFLQTTGDVLDSLQQQAFRQYIESGGGYLGIHAAADCEYDWPWYGRLVGAYFKSHPAIQEAHLWIQLDPRFAELEALPRPWLRTDEWYNWQRPPSEDTVHVLVSIDENSYHGGINGAYHPMVWYHQVGLGRSFYIALGHTAASYSEPGFLLVLRLGLAYAAGLK
jgi:type 1 glutamine amidotransferase